MNLNNLKTLQQEMRNWDSKILKLLQLHHEVFCWESVSRKRALNKGIVDVSPTNPDYQGFVDFSLYSTRVINYSFLDNGDLEVDYTRYVPFEGNQQDSVVIETQYLQNDGKELQDILDYWNSVNILRKKEMVSIRNYMKGKIPCVVKEGNNTPYLTIDDQDFIPEKYIVFYNKFSDNRYICCQAGIGEYTYYSLNEVYVDSYDEEINIKWEITQFSSIEELEGAGIGYEKS